MRNIENYLHAGFWKIESFFTGSQRKKYLYWGLLFVLAVLVFLSLKYKLNVATDTLSWTFSTVAQSLVGLIGLLAVAIIFKLQILTTKEDKLVTFAYKDNEYSWLSGQLTGDPAISGTELLNKLNKILETENPAEQRIHVVKRKLDDLALSRELTKNYLMEFTVFTAFTVLLSLLFLMLSPYLFSVRLGAPCLYVIWVFTGYSFYLAIKGILYNIITG